MLLYKRLFLFYKKYYAKNKERINKEQGIQHMQNNEEARDNASQHFVRWTAADVVLLVDMLSQGRTYREIAYELQRTIYSVSSKINKLRKAGII